MGVKKNTGKDQPPKKPQKKEIIIDPPFNLSDYETWVLYELDPATITDKRVRDWVVNRLRNPKKNEVYLLHRDDYLRNMFKEARK